MKMKMKYTEQAVETLDDAGSVIANKNIEIEQLRQRVAELEERRCECYGTAKFFRRTAMLNIKEIVLEAGHSTVPAYWLSDEKPIACSASNFERLVSFAEVFIAEIAALKTELREICAAIDVSACDLTLTAVECIKKLKVENETAWAQAHRLALELECLLLDTKDNATVSKWWDSGMAALDEYQQLKPGAAESTEAWAKMKKVGL